MVACRKPKTRSAAEGSNPSASADSTTATCCEAVFSRYKGVSRRARAGGAAGRTSEGLDRLSTTVLAISQEARGLERQGCQSSSTAD